MSKRILILNGSPRPNGNTAALVERFAAGARAAGGEVTVFDVAQMNIHGCLGCCHGGKDPASPCVQKDDMGKIYPIYRSADAVVLASPMYYWGISGQLKCAFDRLFAVAECTPDYANPVKDCALLMAAEGDTEARPHHRLNAYDARAISASPFGPAVPRKSSSVWRITTPYPNCAFGHEHKLLDLSYGETYGMAIRRVSADRVEERV